MGKNSTQILIPTLAEEYDIARHYYNVKIFGTLPEDATLGDGLEKMFSMGNADWLEKYMDYYAKSSLQYNFTNQRTDPYHSAFHLKQSSPHVIDGEPANVLMQIFSDVIYNERKIKKGRIKENFELALSKIPREFIEPKHWDKAKMLPYRSDKPITSPENLDLCRIVVTSLFGLMDFKEQAGYLPHGFNSWNLLRLPLEYFKPSEIVYDLEVKFLDFNKGEISPNDSLNLPKSKIKMLDKACILTNKLERGEAIKL